MNIDSKVFHPYNFGGLLVNIGLLSFIIFESIRWILFEWLHTSSLQYEFLNWIVCVLRDLGLVLGIAAMIFFGIRSVRYYGVSLNSVVFPLLGSIGCIGLILFSFSAEKLLTEAQLALDRTELLVKIDEAIKGDQLTKQKLSTLSEWYARTYFIQYGKPIFYLKPDGLKYIFVPSKQDIEDREFNVNVLKEIRVRKASLHGSAFLWIAVLAISLLLAFLTPIKSQQAGNGGYGTNV